MNFWLKIAIPVGIFLLLAASAILYMFYVEAISFPKDGSRDVIDLSPDTRTAGYNGALPPDRYGIWPTREFVTGRFLPRGADQRRAKARHDRGAPADHDLRAFRLL
ncbi:MAG: hypothetical protein LBB75_04110 [Oscillospiraceae bacterium]|nr:hypothetical protein [Oscillospiraceae bacterium]